MHLSRLAFLLVLVAACGGGNGMPDAATRRVDAFSPDLDAPGTDAAGSTDDAFTSGTFDAFVPPGTDAFTATDAATSGDACVRPMTDLSELGADCSDMPCPMGLECIEFVGFALQHYCGIRCEVANGGVCACPPSLECVTVSDKSGPRQECVMP